MELYMILFYFVVSFTGLMWIAVDIKEGSKKALDVFLRLSARVIGWAMFGVATYKLLEASGLLYIIIELVYAPFKDGVLY